MDRTSHRKDGAKSPPIIRRPEAIAVAREALETYRTKGDVVSAGRVEAFLEGV